MEFHTWEMVALILLQSVSTPNSQSYHSIYIYVLCVT